MDLVEVDETTFLVYDLTIQNMAIMIPCMA
jgi:hypothetical protein